LGHRDETYTAIRQRTNVGQDVQGRAAEAIQLPHKDRANLTAPSGVHDAAEPWPIVQSPTACLFHIEDNLETSRRCRLSKFTTRQFWVLIPRTDAVVDGARGLAD
jgi:hypothetical protein